MSSQKRRTSAVWSFFSKADDRTFKAECDLCHQKFSYKTTVSNLKKHIQRKHPGEVATANILNDSDQDSNDEATEFSATPKKEKKMVLLLPRRRSASAPREVFQDQSEGQEDNYEDYFIVDSKTGDLESVVTEPARPKPKKQMTSYEEAVYELQKKKFRETLQHKQEEHAQTMANLTMERDMKQKIYELELEAKELIVKKLKIELNEHIV